MNTQINRANAHRRDVIRSLENAVRSFVYGRIAGVFELPTAIESELVTVAPRPSSLGFSDHDLRHFAGFYTGLLKKAVAERSRANVRAVTVSRLTKDILAKRDKARKRVTFLQLVVDTLQGEIDRREDAALAEARELEAKREALKAEVAREEAEAKAIVESLPPVKLKAPKKGKKSAPKKRDEFKKTITSSDSDNPFEALKGEVTSRQRSNWERKPLKKADAVALAGDEEALLFALRMAQKHGTDEVLDVNNGVICWKQHGNSVRYQLFGAAA